MSLGGWGPRANLQTSGNPKIVPYDETLLPSRPPSFGLYVAFFVQGVGNGFKYVLFFNFEPLSIRGNYQIRLLFK